MHSTSSSEKSPSGVMPLWPTPETVEDVVAAAQHAADVGADLDVVFADGLEMQHGVVTGDIAHVELGDADAPGHFGNDRVGEIADFVLRIEQHGDQCGAADWVLFHQGVKPGRELRRKDRQSFFL